MEIIERYKKMKSEREIIVAEKRKIYEEKLNTVKEKEKILKSKEEDFFNLPSDENENAYKLASTEYKNAKIELDHADSIYSVLISKELKLKCTSEEIRNQAIEYIDSLKFDEDVNGFNSKLNELKEIIQRANIKHDKVRTMLEMVKKLKEHIELTDNNVNIENMVFNEVTKVPKYVPSGIIEELGIEPIVSSIGHVNWIEEGSREREKRRSGN